MKQQIKNKKNYTNKIFLFYLLIFTVIILILYPLIPKILNFPPNSINNTFQKNINKITYSIHYVILSIIILFLCMIVLVIRLRQIRKSLTLLYSTKLNNEKKIHNLKKITKICLNTPFILYFIEILVPLILLPISLLLIKAHPLSIIKICLIYVLFFTIGAVLSFVFSQKEFKHILEQLHDDFPQLVEKISYTNKDIILGKKLSNKLILQLLPLIVVSLCFTSLVMYVQACAKTGDLLNEKYSYLLHSSFQDKKTYTEDEVKNILYNIPDNNLQDSFSFVLKEDGSYYTSNNSSLSKFFITYTLQNSESNKYRSYDDFCVDREGTVVKLQLTNGESVFAGFSYKTSQHMLLLVIFICGISLLIVIALTIIYISNSLVSDIKMVTKSLDNISGKNNVYLNSRLSITSADELKDLCISFNKIQALTEKNIRKIHDNQESLMESERLASLGQLIGGIAHNLKTPIMSISGATEGLSDLIEEYDSSIDDPTVNNNDHHEIASDMSKWVNKIKKYTEYMSDIITAVKGQAVVMSNKEDINFTISELVKRVNILMKHELKNAVITLNTNIMIDKNLTLNGDVNNLVQVINNMISNSIQAYNGNKNESIAFTINKDSKNIIFTIEDHAGGLPTKVKNKLFKEMITTKGKNGTGLGLYMSYSTIKAHFNGEITFETEKGKGTKFNIYIPIKN